MTLLLLENIMYSTLVFLDTEAYRHSVRARPYQHRPTFIIVLIFYLGAERLLYIFRLIASGIYWKIKN